jgi:Ser/Thr protein kinase RdoA (MazF antagonist)
VHVGSADGQTGVGAAVTVQAAVALARRLGLGVESGRVLHVGNNLTVHLVPAPVVAKVCTRPGPHSTASHVAEVAVAEHLLNGGIPIVAPSRALPAGPHPCGPCVATFWEFVDGQPAHDLTPATTGPLLRDLHAALADYRASTPLPSWTSALDAAAAIVLDPAAVAPLPAADRGLLVRLYFGLRARIDGAVVRVQPIHGDARPGNLLHTGNGLRWMDFEAVCLGPVEWDAASMPLGTEAWLADPDLALLAVLRRMRQVCLVIWCWSQYNRTTEIARAAEIHLTRLKDDIRADGTVAARPPAGQSRVRRRPDVRRSGRGSPPSA